MAFNVYVKTANGKSIMTFSEGYSRRVVDSLWKLERETVIKPKPGKCHLEAIYYLDRAIAVPLLLNEVEKLIQELMPYLEEPKGRYDYQKDLYHNYKKNSKTLESITADTLIFDVWDTS